MLFANGAVALALLIAYLAPVTDPRKFWPVAFFGLAYPPLILCNALFIIYWLIRRNKWALISAITILVGWSTLLNNIGFSFSGSKKQTDAGTLRVMTYNVHYFRKHDSGYEGPTRHSFLEVIDTTHPDIIGIPEFFSRRKGRFAMADSLKKLLKTSNYYFEPSQQSGNESIGIAIFSRFPIIAKGMVSIGETGDGNQCIYADVKNGEKIIRFYNAHLQSIRFEPQDYQYLDTVTKSGKADIRSTRRLASKLKLAFLKRADQVFKIKAHAAQCAYPYIISGDFNDTPTSFAVNQMAKGLKNAFREKGRGLGRTYNGNFPNYQIDYIMAGPQFDISSYKIITKKLSDHYPVYADMVLK